VVSLPEEPDILDETAKSSKDDGALRWRCRESDRRRWCFDSATRGGSAGALDGIVSFGGLEDDWGREEDRSAFLFAASFLTKAGKGRSSTCRIRRESFA
jgi:hypothetical protein